MRGQPAPDGTVRIAKNGYSYTKQGGKFRLTHHIIAEQKLGRPLRDDERVIFIDRNRTNLDSTNLHVEVRGYVSDAKKLAQLIARRDELDAQIKELQAKQT